MFKSLSTFLSCYMVTTLCWGTNSNLECNTTSVLEQNLAELETVLNVANGCPKPTQLQIDRICNSINDQKSPKDDAKFIFKYQEDLYEMSCTSSNDEPEVAHKKIREMWDKYKLELKCEGYSGVSVPGANVSKFSMDVGFPSFLVHAVKKYKLDLNFKDPVDGLTVMDFLQRQLESYRRADFQEKVHDYERVYKLLKENGAKHAKEL